MRRLLKWLGILVACVVIAIVALVAYVYVASSRVVARTYTVDAPRVAIPSDAVSIARGKYDDRGPRPRPVARSRSIRRGPEARN